MFIKKFFGLLLIGSILLPNLAIAQMVNPADDAVNKIIDEGMKRSKAMETLSYLTDVIGARLTNSPSQKRANNWTRDRLTSWGLQNATVESWGTFGRGWTLKKYDASLVEPEQIPFHSYPKAWSPSTNGAVTGDVVLMEVKTEADLEQFKGKLKGAIIFTSLVREVKPGFDALASRIDEKGLLALANAGEPGQTQGPGGFRFTPEIIAAQQLNAKKIKMCYDEGAAILVESSQLDAGTIRVMGASLPPNPNAAPPTPGGGGQNTMRVWSKDAPKIIPQIVAAVEQYNRVARMIKQGVNVRMSIDLKAQFNDEDLDGYNTIAEIPGTDLKDEIVMVGGHLDSWHAGTGATDNGAGVTMAMEAIRLIQASGLKPRRTIRVALWTGEEQGLYGSRGYVAKHFAENVGGEIKKKPDFDKFSAYYNLDNGTGQIRGINLQGNEPLRSIYRPWLQSFKDWNATTISVQSVGGTDHQAFDGVGLPGFQFIQDPIEYFGRTWHTTQDVNDRSIEEDLKRSSVIMATFAYNTAMMNEKLPRKQPRILPGVALNLDRNAISEEMAFNTSGLNFSICGHEMHSSELPSYFPTYLAAGFSNEHASE